MWVLRFGGAMALIAAWTTRYVPLTLSERRRRYGVLAPRDSGGEVDLDEDDEEQL